MFQNQGEKELIPDVMFSGGVCYSCQMPNHNCREIDLLPSVHEIDKTLMHDIRKIFSQAPWCDIFYYKPDSNWLREIMSPFLTDLGVCNPVC